jgi:hypothetical protein
MTDRLIGLPYEQPNRPLPHKWQDCINAYKRGLPVEFRNTLVGKRWYPVNSDMIEGNGVFLPIHRVLGPAWDWDWMEFRCVDPNAVEPVLHPQMFGGMGLAYRSYAADVQIKREVVYAGAA